MNQGTQYGKQRCKTLLVNHKYPSPPKNEPFKGNFLEPGILNFNAIKPSSGVKKIKKNKKRKKNEPFKGNFLEPGILNFNVSKPSSAVKKNASKPSNFSFDQVCM